MRILFSHLLNNYTGSPKVLRNSIITFIGDANFDFTILTSKSEGFLSNIEGTKYKTNGYKWCSNKIGVAFYFGFSQIVSFFKVLFSRKYDILYANTILNLGAAIAAKIKGTKIIFHIHEAYLKPNILQKICLATACKTADKIICVSKYLVSTIKSDKVCVIYNSNSPDKKENSIVPDKILKERFNSKIIMMPCSLKTYKGVLQFVELAKILPEFKFYLFCSTSAEEIDVFKRTNKISNLENLLFYSNQKDLSGYYLNSSIVINLSLPDKWIETFGMTLIEAFSYSLPVLAPNYGGPKEIIENAKNGFLIEPFEIKTIAEKIKFLLSDFEIYKWFSINAFESNKKFSWEKYSNEIKAIVCSFVEDKND